MELNSRDGQADHAEESLAFLVKNEVTYIKWTCGIVEDTEYWRSAILQNQVELVWSAKNVSARRDLTFCAVRL